MALTFAVFPDGHAQIDGRRYVLEIHSDAQGEVARIEYLAVANADTMAIATARSSSLAVSLADAEAAQAITVDAPPVLRFQTAMQFLNRLRLAYKSSIDDVTARIARWIAHRINAGDVTATQLRNAFGLTANQWTTLEAKMRVLAADLDAVEQAAGE